MGIVLWLLGTLIYWAASIAIIILFARVILDWVAFFSPQWRPTGVVLVIANLIHTLTDPPVRFLRRRIPPLRLGAVAIDIGFLVLFVSCMVAQNVGAFLVRLA